MCGRYTLQHQQWVEGVFGSDLSRLPAILREPRHNVAPGQMVLALAGRAASPVAEQLHWGVPSPREGGPPMVINARAESVARSPFWRPMLEDGRVLIPADGFYEWRAAAHPRGPKQPYWFSLADGGGFCLAGLATGGGDSRSCVVVTTAPNELVEGTHDRMPVMLDAGAARAWLEGPADVALKLLVPFPSVAMTARAVSTAVNDAARDDVSLTEAVETGPVTSEPEQTSLF